MSLQGQPLPGCEVCRPTDGAPCRSDAYDVVLDELREKAIVRVECYQYDRLLRCRVCRQHWLRQWWEFDTEETQLKEWGVVSAALIPLSEADVGEVESAHAAPHALPHRRFRDGRLLFDLQQQVWTVAVAEGAG